MTKFCNEDGAGSADVEVYGRELDTVDIDVTVTVGADEFDLREVSCGTHRHLLSDLR